MRTTLKWIGIAVGALVGLLLLAVLGMNIAGTARHNRVYDVEPESIIIPTDEDSVERGRHLAQVVCAECHGEDLGGTLFVDEPGVVTIYAPNITTGSGGMGSQPDETLVLAIRHGIDHDGTPLLIMPAEIFINWSAEDIGSVIAYLREAPPVDNSVPPPQFTVMARVLVGAGLFGQVYPAEYIDHTRPLAEMPSIGANPEYGQYLSRAVACTLCHGENLAGGIVPPNMPPGEVPISPNLTPAGRLSEWSEEDFYRVLRTGVTPDGHVINPDHMPVPIYARLTEAEQQALWLYVQSLPATEPDGE